MYFLRGLRLCHVNNKIKFLFYQTVIEGVIRFGIQVWYGNLPAQPKTKLARLTQTAMKIVGKKEHHYLQPLYEECVLREAQKILNDSTHILNPDFQLLPSG